MTFVVENPGSGDLKITGSPRVTVDNPSEFEVTKIPSLSIGPGSNSDFQIEFTPIGAGPKSTIVSIDNNASPGGVFTFTITGTGVVGAGPEIEIHQGSTVIDDLQPYEYDFGELIVNNSSSEQFTIFNMGTASSLLHLLNYPTNVTISGSSSFSVVTQPDKEWLIEGDPVNDNTSFTIKFQPSTAGSYSATISIPNDEVDADEIPFTFTVKGVGKNLDVLFLIDTSGSMGANMATIQSHFSNVISAVKSLDTNAIIGVASLNDFPYGSWGSPPVEAYILHQSLTSSDIDVLVAVNNLFAYGGNDMWGSHLEALYQGATGEGLVVTTPFSYTIPSTTPGWRSDSIKAIIMLSDSPFHNPDTEPPYPGHNFTKTINALVNNGIAMAGISMPGHYGIDDMSMIAGSTGGTVSYYGYLPDDVENALIRIIGN